METFKVLGKLKRKELSFGTNDVHGLNNREERLLQNALGSLEKERKKTLFHIQTEVKDLHDCLKETTKVWLGEQGISSHIINSSTPNSIAVTKISSSDVQTGIQTKQNIEASCDDFKKDKASVGMEERNHDCWAEYSTQKQRKGELQRSLAIGAEDGHIRNSERPTTSITRIRITSTGSMPSSLQREAVKNTLHKTPSSSDIYTDTASPPFPLRRQTPEHVSFSFPEDSKSMAKSPRLLRRRRELKSASFENIRTASPPSFSSPSIHRRKISANLGMVSRRTGNVSFRGAGWSSESSSPGLIRNPTLIQYRSHPASLADLPPSPSLFYSTLDKSKSCSLSEQKLPIRARKISCPQLCRKTSEKEHCSLGSLSGSRALSRLSSELPDVNVPQNGFSLTGPSNEDPPRLCVSPVSHGRSLLDRELQDRVNAFLDSLQQTERDQEHEYCTTA